MQGTLFQALKFSQVAYWRWTLKRGWELIQIFAVYFIAHELSNTEMCLYSNRAIAKRCADLRKIEKIKKISKLTLAELDTHNACAKTFGLH